jgi:hypothetical protein
MKKVVRTIWIGTLSGLAFLAACGTTKGGLTKAERKQLIKERDSIQEILSSREGSTIYGTPEIMAQYKLENYRLHCQLDSINSRFGEDVDLEKSAQRYQLQQRIMELRTIIYERENSCIYGSPEVMEEYGNETRRMRGELEELQKQLKGLGKE